MFALLASAAISFFSTATRFISSFKNQSSINVQDSESVKEDTQVQDSVSVNLLIQLDNVSVSFSEEAYEDYEYYTVVDPFVAEHLEYFFNQMNEIDFNLFEACFTGDSNGKEGTFLTLIPKKEDESDLHLGPYSDEIWSEIYKFFTNVLDLPLVYGRSSFSPTLKIKHYPAKVDRNNLAKRSFEGEVGDAACDKGSAKRVRASGSLTKRRRAEVDEEGISASKRKRNCDMPIQGNCLQQIFTPPASVKKPYNLQLTPDR